MVDMTHTEESLLALVGEWRAHWGCGDIEDSCEIALRLAIREVLAALASEEKMRERSVEGEVIYKQRAEKAEAECERLRTMIRNLCMGHVDNCRCTYCKAVFRTDAAMKEQP